MLVGIPFSESRLKRFVRWSEFAEIWTIPMTKDIELFQITFADRKHVPSKTISYSHPNRLQLLSIPSAEPGARSPSGLPARSSAYGGPLLGRRPSVRLCACVCCVHSVRVVRPAATTESIFFRLVLPFAVSRLFGGCLCSPLLISSCLPPSLTPFPSQTC